MKALEAIAPIRSWAIKRCAGLAILDDVDTWNTLVSVMEDQIAKRVGDGGDPVKMREDLHDILMQEVPLQLGRHVTAVKQLQDGFDLLCDAVELGQSNAPKVQSVGTVSELGKVQEKK